MCNLLTHSLSGHFVVLILSPEEEEEKIKETEKMREKKIQNRYS